MRARPISAAALIPLAGRSVVGLSVVGLALAGCSAAEAPLAAIDPDARSTTEVKREVNASVTEIVSVLTDHDAAAERTLEAGEDYGPCTEGGRGERVGYDFGAIVLESPSFARDWAALEPKVEQAAQRHGYALADQQPAGGSESGPGSDRTSDADRTLIFRNDAADRVEVAVSPSGVDTSAGSSCFPPAD